MLLVIYVFNRKMLISNQPVYPEIVDFMAYLNRLGIDYQVKEYKLFQKIELIKFYSIFP
jgi:hypothetical protein